MDNHYIDGFVLPVANDKIEIYREMSAKAGAIWREYGALEYRECLGDSLEPAEGLTSFPAIAAAKEGETVVFSYIVYKSREHRDEVNAKVIADPRMQEICNGTNAPFDCSRMAYGGFRTFVSV